MHSTDTNYFILKIQSLSFNKKYIYSLEMQLKAILACSCNNRRHYASSIILEVKYTNPAPLIMVSIV